MPEDRLSIFHIKRDATRVRSSLSGFQSAALQGQEFSARDSITHSHLVHMSTVIHTSGIARTDAASRLLASKSDGPLCDPTHRGQNSPFRRGRGGPARPAPAFDAGK